MVDCLTRNEVNILLRLNEYKFGAPRQEIFKCSQIPEASFKLVMKSLKNKFLIESKKLGGKGNPESIKLTISGKFMSDILKKLK